MIIYILFTVGGIMASLPLYGAEELPDSARREESYEHTEYSPLRTTYEVWGWNIPRYYYYQYLHIFADYPWVVRVAYGIVFFCIIGFFFIALAMFIDVYYTERSKRLMIIRMLSVCMFLT